MVSWLGLRDTEVVLIHSLQLAIPRYERPYRIVHTEVALAAEAQKLTLVWSEFLNDTELVEE